MTVGPRQAGHAVGEAARDFGDLIDGRPSTFEAAKLTSADRRADTLLHSNYWETKLPQELPEGTVTVLFTDVEGDMTSRRRRRGGQRAGVNLYQAASDVIGFG